MVALHRHPNDWFVRHARRILQERAAAGVLTRAVHESLAKIAFEAPGEPARLRGLWNLHVTGGLSEPRIRQGLASDSPQVRAWTVQLASERNQVSPELLARFAELAESDASPIVRRYVASAMQRLPLEQRWPIVRHLIGRSEDAADPNLPLLTWYAMEPLAELDADRALHTAGHSTLPNILPMMARRVAALGTPQALAVLVDRMGRTDDAAKQLAMLRGMAEGLNGRRQSGGLSHE